MELTFYVQWIVPKKSPYISPLICERGVVGLSLICLYNCVLMSE